MAFFQKPHALSEETEVNKLLEISAEEVALFDEKKWYEKVYRGDAVQLTWRAVVMGNVLGFFLSFTNIYIGLKTGWFLGVALTACIASYAIWNFFLKLGWARTSMSILENNCMQSTASSAGYATGNSLVSAVPAMLLLSVNESHPRGVHTPWWILGPWIFCLGLLGITLAIPLKRNLINHERLKFPSGTAAAVTLQGLYSKGSEAAQKSKALFWAMGFGLVLPIVRDLAVAHQVRSALKKFFPSLQSSPWLEKTDYPGFLPDSSSPFDFIWHLLPHSLSVFKLPSSRREFLIKKLELAGGENAHLDLSHWTIRFEHSGVLLCAGALVGLRTTVWMVIGGLILAFFLGPIALDAPFENARHEIVYAATSPSVAWKEIGIWLGAPILVAYGIFSFAMQWRSLIRAFEGVFSRGKANVDELKLSQQVEVPMKWFGVGFGLATLGIVILAHTSFGVPFHLGLLAVLMTFILALVSCRVTGETDVTPGGAMGKIMQLTYGVLLPQSTSANLMTASITSGAGLAAADLLNDLKSGYLLGANPRRQFFAQAMGLFTGTVASLIAFYALVPSADVLGKQFPAPGAYQWKAVAEVFRFGIENLHPLAKSMIPVGLLIGSALAAAEGIFPKYKKWVPSASGLGLGFMLPFMSPLAMFLGAFIAHLAEKYAKNWASKYIVPLAAGGIAGESIMSVLITLMNNAWFSS